MRFTERIASTKNFCCNIGWSCNLNYDQIFGKLAKLHLRLARSFREWEYPVTSDTFPIAPCGE